MRKLLLFLFLAGSAVAQTTTTYTGVIKDLSQQPVTSGLVTFTLTQSTDSTIPGNGRFIPTTVSCNINVDGTLSAISGGACVVTMNTALSPSGTAYRICIQPDFSTPGSCFFDYATTASKDITTIVPTLSTGPLNFGGIPGPPLNFLGTWSSTKVYHVGDTVAFNNTVYISLTNPNLNNNPSSSPSNWSVVQSPASLMASPTGTQTITQPVNTSFNVVTSGTGGVGITGPLTATSTNGVLNAAQFPGADLGAKVQSAITALGTTCGRIIVPSGTYTWTTHKVVMNPCIFLEGNGSLVNVSTGTDPALVVVTALPNFSDPHIYDQGGISDITFSGPGPGSGPTTSMGIMVGGDNAGVITPVPNPSILSWVAFTAALHNVHIRNFGCGLNFGFSYQIAVFGGTIENNYDGVCFLNGGGGENMNFHGTQIINNTQYGMYAPGFTSPSTEGGPEINLYGVSLDYNGQSASPAGAQIYTLPPYSLNIFGGHMENRFTPFILVPASTAQATVNISDVRFTLVPTAAGPMPSYLQVAGTSSIVHIDGLSINNVGNFAGIPASLIDYTPVGNSGLFVTNFYSTFQGNGFAVPIIKPGNTFPAFFESPVFDSFGNIIGSTSGGITVNSLKVNSGIISGPGMQHYRIAGGCATGAAVGATCTTSPMTWPAGMANTNYTVSCTLSNPTGVPTVSSINRVSGTQFTVTIAALTPAAAGGDLNCIAMHD